MGDPIYIQEFLRKAAMRRGRLQSTQVCPKCKRRGKYALKSYDGVAVLECVCGRFAATKGFRVRLGHQGRDLHIYHTQAGRVFASLEQAQGALEIIRGELKDKSFLVELWQPTSPLVWENYLAAYLEREAKRVLAGEIGPSTLRKKRSIAKHLAGLDGRNLRELKEGHLQDLAAGLHHLAPKTRADIMQELHHILDEALYRRAIPRMIKVPTVQVHRSAPAWMSEERQTKVLDHILDEHHPIFFFLVQYGCRVSEACNLTWGNIHLAEKVLVLTGTKQRRDNPLPIWGWFEDWLGRRARGFPHMPVFVNPNARSEFNQNALQAISLTKDGLSAAGIAERLGVCSRSVVRWRNLYRKSGKAALRNKHRHVNALGSYHPGYVRDILHEAREASGVPEIKLKNFTRHSLGNQLRRHGMDEGLIARMLGHASTQHIRRFYVDTDVELLRERLRTHGVHTAKSDTTTSRNNK